MRAKLQYRHWVVVDLLDEPVADGQLILRIQSPDGSQTLVTSNVALLGLDDEDDEGEG